MDKLSELCNSLQYCQINDPPTPPQQIPQIDIAIMLNNLHLNDDQNPEEQMDRLWNKKN